MYLKFNELLLLLLLYVHNTYLKQIYQINHILHINLYMTISVCTEHTQKWTQVPWYVNQESYELCPFIWFFPKTKETSEQRGVDMMSYLASAK